MGAHDEYKGQGDTRDEFVCAMILEPGMEIWCPPLMYGVLLRSARSALREGQENLYQRELSAASRAGRCSSGRIHSAVFLQRATETTLVRLLQTVPLQAVVLARLLGDAIPRPEERDGAQPGQVAHAALVQSLPGCLDGFPHEPFLEGPQTHARDVLHCPGIAFVTLRAREGAVLARPWLPAQLVRALPVAAFTPRVALDVH